MHPASNWLQIPSLGETLEDAWDVLQQALGGHTSSVLSVTYSMDGKGLASASGDSTIQI